MSDKNFPEMFDLCQVVKACQLLFLWIRLEIMVWGTGEPSPEAVCVTGIPALDVRSLLRIKVKRRVTLCFTTSQRNGFQIHTFQMETGGQGWRQGWSPSGSPYCLEEKVVFQGKRRLFPMHACGAWILISGEVLWSGMVNNINYHSSLSWGTIVSLCTNW